MRHQEAIGDLSRHVLRGMDSDRLLAECVALVTRTLEVEACALLESVPKDGHFIVRASSGLPDGTDRRTVSDSPGSIEVESDPGRGTTFRVRLPAGAAGKAPRRPRTVAPHRDQGPDPSLFRRGHRVLYIVDNHSNFCLVRLLLEKHPQITLLNPGRATEGLEMLRRHPVPDLLLLDLHLPDLSGEEVLTRLRGDPDATVRRVPVVIMTAAATAASVERILALGADAYLTKPLDLNTVLSTLHHCLETPENPPLRARE